MMNTKKCFSKIGSLILGAILFFSCSPTKPEVYQVDPAYGEYISAYTSGMVTRKSNIRIELSKGMYDDIVASNGTVPTGKPSDKLIEDIFSFEPAIKGKAVWINDRVIEFIPDENLPTNQFYNVDFELERVAKVPGKYENFHFQFATFQQTLFVDNGGLISDEEYNVEWLRFESSITTSDYEDTSKVMKTLKAELNGKELPIKLNYSYNDNKYNFYVDSIERINKVGKLILTWDGSSIHSMSKGRKTIDIPALGDFKISSTEIHDRDDQLVNLYFTEPMDFYQNLDGLIRIEGIDNLTFKTEGSVISVFLPNRISGVKKIMVSSGIKNVKGHGMLKAYEEELTFQEPKPRVRIRGNGSILPNSQGLIFPFESISLKSVDVRIIKIYENNIHHFLQINDLSGDDGLTRFGKIITEKRIDLDYDKTSDLKQWNKHVIDLGTLITPDPGAIYRISIKFKKEYALCDCTAEDAAQEASSDDEDESYGEDYDSEEEYDPNWTEKDWHGYGFDGGYESWEYYSDEYTPCNDYYYNGKAVSRNILASDLGIVFKLDEDKKSHAFVSNMITTEPVANAQIQYFDFAKQVIASGTTDGNGMMELKLSEKPFLMIAKNGKQRGYLKLADGYINSLSKFDVKGERVQKGVKGFIYGERGVWRPGDSLYLTFILEDKDRVLPSNHPVKFELMDPNGQIVYEATKSKNTNGMYDFRTMTGHEAPTGNYTALARVGNRSYTKNIKIETVKPNRLKIYLDLAEKQKNDSTRLSAKWLHGAVAKKMNATVNVTVSEGTTHFDKFKNYVFDSPIRSFQSEEETIFDGKLSDKGEAYFKTELQVGQNAPGMLRATYITKVFEAGGDFSIDRTVDSYSPFKTYVGLEVPESKNSEKTLETDNNYKFNVVTVSEKGKLVSTDKIQVKVYKMKWRWWYEKDDEDFANYISRNGSIVVKDTTINAVNGQGSFRFKVKYPEYGRYLITVTDLEGHHQTGQIINIDWPYWNRANRSSGEHANMLNFNVDKEKYKLGENIKLSFPAPSNGRALVSVETRSKVVKKFWIDTKRGETTYEFPTTKEMSPNAYVHVTLIQPHASTKNDLPIRMYGVVPVMVDDPNTHLTPEIVMADEIKPESKVNIKVKEKNGKKMTYTLEIVDEGLLDLTKFSTPQPWDVFYAREALGVKTWDMYDDVIGAYSGKLDKLLSIGGDGDLMAGKGAKANRFKPMVVHLGPFTVEAGAQKTHQVSIPNYVGSVRVMVVAQNESAYGNAEKTVAVKKPLMVLASLPRVLGPAETVYLPVNVFAMEKNIKNVSVSIEVNDLLQIEGVKQQTIHFSEPGDEVVNFKLKVKEKIGIARVKIIATCDGERATEEIELDVRTPNPKVVDSYEKTLEAGKEWNTEILFKGITGSNKATIEVSNVPSMDLEKRLDYLIEYPHGCIEQTTSAGFPQLMVSNLVDVNSTQADKIAVNVKAALKRIQLFQTSEGGFSYWPGESTASDWGTNYAGHFMLEAEKKGYNLPAKLKEKWLKYQQKQAKDWNGGQTSYGYNHAKESDELIQAYRLYVLALSSNPELGAMNRLREEQNLSAAAKWRLAAAYKLIGQGDVAQNLVAKLSTSVTSYKELSNSYGSDRRDKAMILETLSLLRNDSKAEKVAAEVASALSSDQWMSTQETAYSLLAMSEFAGVRGKGKNISFSFNLDAGAAKDKSSLKNICQLKFTDQDFAKKAKLKFKNKGTSKLYFKVIIEGIPLQGDQSSAASNLSLKLKFKDLNGGEIKPDKLKQGTEFLVEVTVKNPGKKGFYKELALTQIFPSGWEINNSRLDGTSGSEAARYQDIRDDRVYSYYELATGESKTFTVRLNVTYLGRFYLPTTYTEAMYDQLINARAPGKWVEVVQN